ncbi:DUF4328 domain-containing protein [Streptomyces sp. enrichment culture]|uniref:DUF4328 domain-containing protein n=1 Tax=Streptomyces sp. enrichment culture TaxID=1795815 RepID=UPI003F5800AD
MDTSASGLCPGCEAADRPAPATDALHAPAADALPAPEAAAPPAPAAEALPTPAAVEATAPGLTAPAAAAPPRSPAPVKPLRSIVGLSYGVTGLLVLVALLDVLAVYAALNSYTVIGDLYTADDERYDALTATANQADMLMYFSASFSLMALIATGIVFIVWFHRARTNAEVFGPDEQRRTPGWAIGSWFIPIANLWIPRKIAGDIWDASELDKRAPRTVLNAWWTLWIVASLAGRSAERLWERAEEYDAIRRAALGLAASSVLDLAAAVAAVLFVRRLTAMQHAKAMAGRPRRPDPAAMTAATAATATS